MAEAAFSITADITPEIDERELERQAGSIARLLNNILAKQIDKVGIRPDTGGFKPFQQELNRAKGFVEKLQGSLNAVPRTLGNVAKVGKSAFFKFTDAINVTRREIVGFGGSIRETIQDTNLFEKALDSIKAAGGTLSELPDNFENLSAQVRSGTSVIDRMAEGGDRLARIFQPIQQQGESFRTELVDISGAIDQLTRVVTQFAAASGKNLDVTKDDFDLLGKSINDLEKPFFRVQAILNDAGLSATDFGKNLRATFAGAAGDPEQLVKALVALRDEAQKTAGPMGLLAQVLGRVTAEERAAAKAARLELNASLIELGQGQHVQGLQRLAARFALIREGVVTTARDLNNFRLSLANLLPGRSPIGVLINDISQIKPLFQALRSDGASVFAALRDSITGAFEFSTTLGNINNLKTKLQELNAAATQSGANFRAGFKELFPNASSAISTFTADVRAGFAGLGNIISKDFTSGAKVSSFLQTNLSGPLRSGLQTLKIEVQRLGQEITAGLGKGIDAGTTILAKAVISVKDAVVGGVKKLFRISSPAKVMIPFGRSIVEGLVAGITGAAGLVGKALSGLLKGVGALAGSAFEFAKSAATVTGVAFAGLAASALHTGKEFNVLKQVINASLPVIVGSKAAAAGLLEEVNALNDTSPFARSSFLELTRVLAGFGVEAGKITPLIDAIQQTVAATGGSDQDLLELGQAFARIQSQGRLSLDVLQSFSSRGVDAIGILGVEFDKTQSQMREMISGGLVPADKAIDALTKGLKEKFDGATDAVSKNFPGALQRVQARLRDIGGTLLTAFITPTGGGALVTFLNNMADSLSHINKNVLPALAPLLQTVANALVVASEKVKAFVTSLSGVEFKGFIDGLGPVLPLLAAFVAFLPSLLGFIPVIGPLLAGLGGPFTALAAALGVVAVQSGNFGSSMKTVADTVSGAFTFIKDNVAGVIAFLGIGFSQVAKGGGAAAAGFATVAAGGGKLAGVFSKLAPLFQGVLQAFPKLVGAAKFLSGPIGIIISIITSLIVSSEGFRAALGRLFQAVLPVAKAIGGILAVAMKVLDEAIKALEPIFIVVVNLLASLFESLKGPAEKVTEFIKALIEAGVIERIFEGIKKNIELTIATLNVFIGVLDAALGPILNLPELEIKLDVDPLKKAADEAKKKLEEQEKLAEESSAAIEDNYNAAAKAVETATAKMSGAIDTLRQGLETVDQALTGIFEAAKAVEAAAQAVVDATQGLADANAKLAASIAGVAQIEKDRARALEDVITPVNELAVATRNLTKIQNSLRDLDRELIDLAKEKAALTGEQAADDRAGLARGETRAQINLNKALQAQIDLENELNGANKVSINLAGLSLDQIRAKLAAVRATNKARSGERDQTAQEIADEQTSAQLDVEDAQQGVRDAKQASLDFEEETKTRIRDIDERSVEIEDDKADILLDQETAIKSIVRLREGETTQQAIILSFDEKIAGARDQIAADTKATEKAATGITTAISNALGVQLELNLKSAILRGDVEDIAAAYLAIWGHKQTGLTFDGLTQTAIDTQKSSVGLLLDEYRKITEELKTQQKLLAAAATLKALDEALIRAENLQKTLEGGRFVPPQLLSSTEKNVESSLRSVLTSGAVTQNGEPFQLSPHIINKIIGVALTTPTSDLRRVLKEIFERLGVQVPGFALGYAPGDLIHSGLNNGMGIARMFEYGKEAVLPLTRKFDLARVVQNPQVLPKILDALPRWRMPDRAVDGVSSTPSDLATVIRSARSGGGPANADVYQKKAQREFAGTIGAAVKVAVKEALAESGSLGGDDIDINVMPSSGNERLIAREVRRQIDKATGKW